MEQSNQEITQKLSLSKEIKIAARTLLMWGVFYLFIGIYNLIKLYLSLGEWRRAYLWVESEHPEWIKHSWEYEVITEAAPLFFFCIYGCLCVIFSYLLFKKKKKAWAGALILCLLSSIGSGFLIAGPSHDLLVSLFWIAVIGILSTLGIISFILLILDRKSFFKIAS